MKIMCVIGTGLVLWYANLTTAAVPEDTHGSSGHAVASQMISWSSVGSMQIGDSALHGGAGLLPYVGPARMPSVARIAPVGLTSGGRARPPLNDDCANAIAFDLLPGRPVTYTGDNTDATEDCPILGEGMFGDSWYVFTIREKCNVTIDYCGTTPSLFMAYFYVVLDTTCPCSGNWIWFDYADYVCPDGNPLIIWKNLPAGTYYYPVIRDRMTGPGPYMLTFQAETAFPDQACPGGTLSGQVASVDTWQAATSGVTPDSSPKVFENFVGLSEAIGGLHWWGLVQRYDPELRWIDCDPNGITIDITFHEDDNGQPGAAVRSYLSVVPTITAIAANNGEMLYYFEVPDLTPCVTMDAGWFSVQSHHPTDGALRWFGSKEGDRLSYVDLGWGLEEYQLDFSFCLQGGACPDVYGACCNDFDGVCDAPVAWTDCLEPWRFTPDATCAELTPPCGVTGACCDPDFNCVTTGFEADCVAVGGRFFEGESCDSFVCPTDCEHRIVLHSCGGSGWAGNFVDVYVNGTPVLEGITLLGGNGPLEFTFHAETGDAIETVYTIDGWDQSSPYYELYDGRGYWLGSDGVEGFDCNVVPVGLTVAGNCDEATTGACCHFAGGCDLLPPEACIDGEWLGYGSKCDQCPPCYLDLPPTTLDEPEPCGEDMNSGCLSEQRAFSPLDCGDAIHGTLWVQADPEGRDYDWYEVVPLTEPMTLTFSIESQVPATMMLAETVDPNDCFFYTTLTEVMVDECEPASVTIEAWPDRTYWVVVATPWYLKGNLPCAQDYLLTLDCVPTPTGACCESAGCVLTYETMCLASDGIYGGDGTVCGGNDCNGNDIADECDIAMGLSPDCNGNGVPDECDIADGTSADVDANNVPDECDPDCNGNGVPDACEVPGGCETGQCGELYAELCGAAADCQPDGVPDSCQLDSIGGVPYQLDDGTHERAAGLSNGGTIAWMNRFVVVSGGEVVNGISVAWGMVPSGVPCTVHLWSDPDQDGDPSDARVLASAPAQVVHPNSSLLTTISIPPTTIGPAGTSFFAGAVIQHSDRERPAPWDENSPNQARSWIAADTMFALDPDDLSAASVPPTPAPGNWLIRVRADSGDCNQNGIPDNCDIDTGFSHDCDGNYIPDECDLAAGAVDCQSNGIPDICEPDCDGNGIADDCDIRDCDGSTWCSDCNADEVLDTCQTGLAGGYVYQSDDGTAEWQLGMGEMAECVWIQHFTAQPGAETIAGVSTCFGTRDQPWMSGVMPGDLFRVFVWDDPDGDGSPADAILLATVDGYADAGSIDTDVVQEVPVPPTRVAGSYFVGAAVWSGVYPAPMDGTSAPAHGSWFFVGVPDQSTFDPDDLSNAFNIEDAGFLGNWMLRAVSQPGPAANDCNGNGIPDDCDLCGDLDLDGDVDYDDYVIFLEAFGGVTDGAPAEDWCCDYDDSGAVGMADFDAWLSCYRAYVADPLAGPPTVGKRRIRVPLSPLPKQGLRSLPSP